MTDERSAMQELSKSLFGQVHRLAIMLAIAESDGLVNPTDLSFQLRLSQSALQGPIRDLVDGGLLTREARGGRRTIYRRVDSKGWDFVRELAEEARRRERARPVRNISVDAG
jgi:DNA-binding MarR family transcriptional regulator